MIKVVDTSNFDEFEYPEKLKGAWFYYVFFKQHPLADIDGICCVYFNDKYPSGSVCTGDYILNDYPDAYSTWSKPDKDGKVKSAKTLVSPVLRNNGIAIAAGAYGMKMLQYVFNKTVHHISGSEFANKAYASASEIANLPKSENPKVEKGVHMNEKFFDHPVYPYVMFGKRVSE